MDFNPTKNCQIIDFNHIFVDDLQKSCLFDLNRKKNSLFLKFRIWAELQHCATNTVYNVEH